MIRSSYSIIDETFCAIQGLAGAHLLNIIKGTEMLNPAKAAICFAGVALIEKIINELSKRVIPGSTGFLGPIPITTKSIVSYGLATYTTFKIMELAGLMLTVPSAIVAIGAVSSTALAIAGIITIIKHYSKSFEERLQEHIASITIANEVFRFKNEDREYDIRIICNPQQRTVNFQAGGLEALTSQGKYIIACDTPIPQVIINKLNTLLGERASIFTATINNEKPLSYTLSPQLDHD